MTAEQTIISANIRAFICPHRIPKIILLGVRKQVFQALLISLLAMGQEEADQYLESTSFPLREAFRQYLKEQGHPPRQSFCGHRKPLPLLLGVLSHARAGKSVERGFWDPTVTDCPNPEEVKSAKLLLRMRSTSLRFLFPQLYN